MNYSIKQEFFTRESFGRIETGPVVLFETKLGIKFELGSRCFASVILLNSPYRCLSYKLSNEKCSV